MVKKTKTTHNSYLAIILENAINHEDQHHRLCDLSYQQVCVCTVCPVYEQLFLAPYMRSSNRTPSSVGGASPGGGGSSGVFVLFAVPPPLACCLDVEMLVGLKNGHRKHLTHQKPAL